VQFQSLSGIKPHIMWWQQLGSNSVIIQSGTVPVVLYHALLCEFKLTYGSKQFMHFAIAAPRKLVT
jgi:hypothetical protein